MGSENNEKEKPAGIGRYDLIEYISVNSGLNRHETSFGSGTIETSGFHLLSHEMMLEGTDFNLVYFPLKHLGYKLVIRTISGIYASGGRPDGLSFSIGMSSRFGRDEAMEITLGVRAAAEKYGAVVKFFDIFPSFTGLTLSATAWGNRLPSGGVQVPPAVNDLICVTGDLGAAYTGLQVLERERMVFEKTRNVQPELTGFEYTIGRQLRPDLRTGVLDSLSKAEVTPSSVTVIREGLAASVIGMCRTQGTGCRIFYDKIPVDRETHNNASSLNSDPVIAALHGGDDFEFLIVVPIAMVKKINTIAGITMVGYLTDRSEGCYLVTPDESAVDLKAQGWG